MSVTFLAPNSPPTCSANFCGKPVEYTLYISCGDGEHPVKYGGQYCAGCVQKRLLTYRNEDTIDEALNRGVQFQAKGVSYEPRY